MNEFCAFCGAELPPDIRRLRHRTQDDTRPLCCNREHEVARRQRDGIYKAMSEAGYTARVAAVIVSNSEHPRRKRAAK